MDKNGAMQKITLDAKAGEVSAELVRRGIAADARVHVLVELVGGEADLPSMAAVAEAGGAFDWLADEPELYTDGASAVEARRPSPLLCDSACVGLLWISARDPSRADRCD